MLTRRAFRAVHGTAAALAAMACAWAMPAQAGVLALAMPATLVSPDAMSDPAIVLPDLPDLDLLASAAPVTLEREFNAALAASILRSVGGMRAGTSRMADLREVFTAKDPGPLTGSPSLAAIANPTFGAPDRVAVSVAQELVSTGTAATGLNSDIRIRHAGSGLDAAFNLAGRRDFSTPDPMAVSYDGHALVNVGPAIQLGVAARGNLGTVSALALGNSPQTAGPLFHLNLIDRNMSLVSDVGYDFGLNPVNTTPRSQLRVKMALKIKL